MQGYKLLKSIVDGTSWVLIITRVGATMFIFILNRLTMEVLLSVALNPSHRKCNSTLMQYSRYCGLENSLFNRIGRYCNFSEYNFYAASPKTVEDYERLYCQHVKYVRRFVHDHKSLSLIEFSIEGPNVGDYLAGIFSSVSSREGWGHVNANFIK